MAVANPVSLFLMLVFLGVVFAVFECEIGGKPMYYQTEERTLEREKAKQIRREEYENGWLHKLIAKSIEKNCLKEKNLDTDLCIRVRNNGGVYKLE